MSIEQEKVLSPATIPYAVTRDTSIASNTQLNLQNETDIIEIHAIADAIYLLYGAGTASSSNFHEYIPLGSKQNFVIPNDLAGNKITEVNFIDNGGSGEIIVIEK